MRRTFLAVGLVILATSVTAQDQPAMTDTAAREQIAPTTVDPGQIQTLRQQLEAVQKANEDASKTSQKNLDEMNKRLTDVRQQLERAKGVANQIASLTTLVNETSGKLAALEAASEKSANSAIDVDKIRYLAGEEIQKVLVHNAATLSVSTKLGSTLSDFQKTMNPEADPDFKDELDKLQGRISHGRSNFVQRVRNSGWLANPLVSLAISFGTFLIEERASEKLDDFANVICLTQFASQNISDVRLIDQEIKKLDARVSEFKANSETRFSAYVSSVGYAGGYRDVQSAINNTSQDPTRAVAAAFFTKLPRRSNPSEPLPAAYIAVRFQTDKVKEYISEYDQLVKDTDAFFVSFQQVVEKDAAVTGDCATKKSVARASDQLRALAKNVAAARQQFQDAYFGSVSQESKRILYSGE